MTDGCSAPSRDAGMESRLEADFNIPQGGGELTGTRLGAATCQRFLFPGNWLAILSKCVWGGGSRLRLPQWRGRVGSESSPIAREGGTSIGANIRF